MFGIKSSVLISPGAARTTLVRRSSLYLFLISTNSSRTTAKILASLPSNSFRYLINACFSFNSSSIFCRSKPASFCKRISKIARACNSENLNSLIKFASAVFTSFDFLMSLIISSMWSNAFFKPSKMCSRASACFKSNLARRIIISRRCFKNSSKIALSESSLGTPSTSANIL